MDPSAGAGRDPWRASRQKIDGPEMTAGMLWGSCLNLREGREGRKGGRKEGRKEGRKGGREG